MNIDDLESKAKAATPGPWKPGHWSGQCHMDHRHGRGNCDYQYTFVEPAPDNCGWSTICMSNEPVQHITTCDEYGSLSKEDSKYIASASPDVVLKLLAVVKAAKDSENKFMAINDGFFTGLVPPEFGPVSISLRALEQGKDE